MTLFRDGRETPDEWTRVADGEPLPADKHIVLTKARIIADRDVLRGRNVPYGVVLGSGDNLDGIEDDLPRLSLVVLDIPKYADGRLYSIARLLRERHGFAGEIRASGDVLRDQIMALHRVGVDTFDVTHAGTIAALQAGTIVATSLHTQAAARDGEEVRDAGLSWRRTSPRGSVPGVKT